MALCVYLERIGHCLVLLISFLMIYFLNTFWSYYWISHIDSLFKNLYFKECRHAGWSCKDQKDPRNCKNEAILQEIKTPIKFCTSTSSKSYRTICSKPKNQCSTVVGLHATPLIIKCRLQVYILKTLHFHIQALPKNYIGKCFRF